MEILEKLGFGRKWREWVSALLATSSSSVLLNGIRGQSFRHGTGLRQGDPLSLLLFIIAFDPLQRLLQMATEENVLSPLQHSAARFRISMYVDDARLCLWH